MSTGLYSGTSGLALGVGLYAGNPGLWGGAAGLITGNGASLYLNFLAGAPLDPRITFSRGSNATLVDSTGKITYAPANLLLQSQTFDNASWTKAAATVTANATAAPDGTSTADKLTPDVTSASHFAGQTVTTTAVAHTYSAYLKADGYSWAILYASGVNQGVYFDLANGVVGSSFIGAPTSSSITPVGNGWYLCSITFTATTGTAARVYASPANTVSTFAGDGTSGLFVWGAQLEQVTYQTTPSTYNATTSAAYYGPRFDYDPVTLAAKGLLIEEQRVNLLLRSEEFEDAAWNKTGTTITANNIASPDGTVDADKATANAALSLHMITQARSVTAATVYTVSFFVKAAGYTKVGIREGNLTGAYATFNLATGTKIDQGTGGVGSITPIQDGWYRIDMVATSGGTSFRSDISILDPAYTSGPPTGTWTGDGTSGIFLWGAQLEAGAFATSYIPTVASQVTRSADVATMTGTNFSSWYNQSEGTFVVNLTPVGAPSGAANTRFLEANDGTANNRKPLLFSSGTGVASSQYRVAGADQALLGSVATGIFAPNVNLRLATAYAVNDFGASYNGATVVADASGSVSNTATQLTIGYATSGAGGEIYSGHIRQIAYYNTRLPNATLVSLTT